MTITTIAILWLVVVLFVLAMCVASARGDQGGRR
jgi:hypothetical protein